MSTQIFATEDQALEVDFRGEEIPAMPFIVWIFKRVGANLTVDEARALASAILERLPAEEVTNAEAGSDVA